MVAEPLSAGSKLPFSNLEWTVITTAASLLGWGAHTKGAVAQATWTREESLSHINLPEFRAIHLARDKLSYLIRGQKVLVKTDNVTAKAYVNKQDVQSTAVHKEAAAIITWTEAHLGAIQAEHVAGVDSSPAVWLNRRQILETEWQLNP